MQKGLESADLIADRFAATGRVECTARIAAHERKTLFRKMLLALKSGNFGEADFFERADRVLAGEAG